MIVMSEGGLNKMTQIVAATVSIWSEYFYRPDHLQFVHISEIRKALLGCDDCEMNI